MQIKSYILVRVTEAFHFVSGLHYQIGFFLSVVLVHIVFSRRNRGKHILTFKSWPSFLASQFWRLPRTGAVLPCHQRAELVRPAALEAFPSSWGRGGAASRPLQLLGGSSSSNKVWGFWHLQTSPHKYTEKADQTVILHGGTLFYVKWQTILPGALKSSSGDVLNM